MAFPQVQDADTTSGVQATDVTSHPILLPANRAAGDRVLLGFVTDEAPTVTGWPSGWNVIATQTTPALTDTLIVAEKIIAGSESNFSLTTSTAQQSVFHSYRVTGAHASTLSAGVGATGAITLDFAALDPAGWGAEDTLWFIFGANVNGTRTVTTWPAGYTGSQRRTGTETTTTGASLASAYRTLAASSEDPGTLTWTGGADLAGITIAVRPAAVVTQAGTTRQVRYNVYEGVGASRLIRYDVSTVATEGAGATGSAPFRMSEEQAERAMLRGNLGQIEYRYRLFKSNNLSERIQEIKAVEEASFSLDNMRDHTWELSMPLDVIDYLDVWGDYVRLEVEMSTGAGIGGGGYTINRPFGLYYFDERAGEDAPERRKWDLGGKSPEARLMGSTAEAGYSIAGGQPILSAVRAILLAQGVPEKMIIFPPSSQDVAMGTTTYFDPFNNATDTRWLRICNTVLAAGGFLALFADNEGRLTTRKINTSNRIEPSHTYGTTPESDRMIVSETIPYTYDDQNFANRVVVYSGDPSEAASYGVAENHDPNSAVSYERLGYWVQKEPIELPSLVSPTEAQEVALAALRVASGMSLRVNFDTVFDTRLAPRQAYGLEVFSDAGEAIYTGDAWPVLSVSAPLNLAPMHHEVQLGISL